MNRRNRMDTNMEIAQLLIANLLLSLALFVFLWLVNLALKDPSFVDGWWALGMVVLAAQSFFFVGQGGKHAIALTVICGLWGIRLGSYLLWRWRSHGPDRRYVAMMAMAKTERGWGYGVASLLLVFAIQMPLQFIVALPVQLGQVGPDTPLGRAALGGIALALFGILFESVGDFQLARFKADPSNAGKVMQTGLWRFTRHPNYFGDACTWWGLYLIAADHGLGVWSAPGPVLLTVLLTRWSGVPTIEGRMRRKKPDYDAYVERTSGFIPWFPRRPSSGTH
jgi:steroid 5-alpha reductase family enzyme